MAEVTGLSPEGTAVLAGSGAKPPARGKSQPGLRCKTFAELCTRFARTRARAKL